MNHSAHQPPETPTTRPREPSAPANGLVLTALVLIGLYLCYRLALPFLPAISWALALAVVLGPLQRKLESKWKRRNLVTAISLAVIAVIVVVPGATGRSRALLHLQWPPTTSRR